MKKSLICISVVLFFLFHFCTLTFAHSYSIAFTKVDVSASQAVVQYAIDQITLLECLQEIDTNQDDKLSPDEITKAKDKLLKWIKKNLTVQVNGQQVNWKTAEMALNPDPLFKDQFKYQKGFVYKNYVILGNQYLTVSLHLDAFPSGSTVRITDHFHTFVPSEYGNFLNVTNHGKTTTTVLFNGAWSYSFKAGPYQAKPFGGHSTDHATGKSSGSNGNKPANPNTDHTAAQTATNSVDWLRFLKLGSNHILTGTDHLLFLLTLVLLRMRFKDYAKIISSFTIAHSLTLALSVLGIISLPSRFVETMIALSIVYVAVENLFFRNASRHRWWLTFLFGLIHGLGFADLLVKMHLPKTQLIQSLLSFNLGIEITQLSLVALVFPLLWFWHRSNWYGSTFKILNVAAACMAVVWVIQRAFFMHFS